MNKDVDVHNKSHARKRIWAFACGWHQPSDLHFISESSFSLLFCGTAPSGRFVVELVRTVLPQKRTHPVLNTVSRDSGMSKHEGRLAHPYATGASFLVLVRKWRYSQTKIIMFARHQPGSCASLRFWRCFHPTVYSCLFIPLKFKFMHLYVYISKCSVLACYPGIT